GPSLLARAYAASFDAPPPETASALAAAAPKPPLPEDAKAPEAPPVEPPAPIGPDGKTTPVTPEELTARAEGEQPQEPKPSTPPNPEADATNKAANEKADAAMDLVAKRNELEPTAAAIETLATKTAASVTGIEPKDVRAAQTPEQLDRIAELGK